MEEGTITLSPFGHLSIKQLIALFSSLPLDVIFVDENNEVQFYSNGRDKATNFSRSVVGKNLLVDHPKQYRSTVAKHIDRFKRKLDRQAEFLDNDGGKTIYTACYGVYDLSDQYIGCLEVVQEIDGLINFLKQKKLVE